MPKQDKANTTNVFRDKNSRRGKAAAADKSETDFQYEMAGKRRVIIRKKSFREKNYPGAKSQSESDHYAFLPCYNKGVKDESSVSYKYLKIKNRYRAGFCSSFRRGTKKQKYKGETMNKIVCPKCGEEFELTDADYLSIVDQVKTEEIAKVVNEKEKSLKIVMQADLEKQMANKELEIEKLNSKIRENELNRQAAINEAVQKQAEKISALEQTLAIKNAETQSEIEKAVLIKENEISRLKAERESEKNLMKDRERQMQEQIDFYKDLKARMSTKMVGETLEQHCQVEFNKIRMAGFKNAYFEKDNDASSGSKGDYIFRDFSDDGQEFVSIMFEMKNECDTTATKHKNEDFLKELDKDRREKKCEYAVLVSLLETDSEFYNAGIVDMSYKYPKTYVIRPQFFIPLITLIRNEAMNSLEYKKQLALIQNQNIDITHFEENLVDFQNKFANNYRIASDKFKNAIDEIDKTIDHLQKVKDGLLGSERQLRIANDKAQDLSIKKLTKDNPTMKKKFEDLKEEGE